MINSGKSHTFIRIALLLLLNFVQNVAIAESKRNAVLSALKDPESARFGREYQNGNFGCIEVNAKNAFGGYVGKKTAVVRKIGNGWVVFRIDETPFEICKASADDVVEEKKYEAEIEKQRRLNPKERQIPYKLISNTSYWIPKTESTPDVDSKMHCAGWLSAAMHQDVVYHFSMHKRYSHDEIFEVYANNHPMAKKLNSIIDELGRDNFELHVSEYVRPTLRKFVSKMDEEVGSPNTALGSRYVWFILLDKAKDSCKSAINNYSFTLFEEAKSKN